MNNKHLAAHAKLILRELHMRRATFLHVWMAEYIAECLEMLENDPTDAAIKDRCAATIARLWQAHVADRRQSLAHAGDVYRTRARLTNDVLAELRTELLSNVDIAKGGAFESSVRLRHLTALEEQVLEVYGVAVTLREGRDKKAATDKSPSDDAEILELLADLRRETETAAQRIVAAVFVEFANVDLEELDAVECAAKIALRAIDRARRQRLGVGRSSPSQKAAAKKRGSKKSSKPAPSKRRTQKK